MDYDSIQSIDIEGWASPEGELRRNQQLSNNRSLVGKKWFEKELESYLKKQSKETKSFMKRLTYKLYDKGEDWDGFINALKNANIEDKDKIINVIQSQATKIQKEQQIQNMIAIYDEIDQKILPCLRRCYFKISCVENLRTDEEIMILVNISPDSLTKNELLYAASLTNDMEMKKKIFSKAIELHPEDYRGYNDLACIKVAEGKTDEAKKLFENANVLKANNDVVLINLGVMSYQNKEYDKAEKYFNESQNAGMDQSKNLTLVKDTIYTIDYQTRPDIEETVSMIKQKSKKAKMTLIWQLKSML
jgi:tetratricopeptide (TPR) repeat protein